VKPLPKIKPVSEMIIEQFEDLTIRILLIAATLSIIAGIATKGWSTGWIEGVSIYFAVLLIVSLTLGNDYMKNRQFLKLIEQVKDIEVSVIRGQHGTTAPVNVWNLVVGDIVMIEAGMRVPADCLLIEGLDVEVDEAYYNDEETKIVKKRVATPEDKSEFEMSREAEKNAWNPDPFLLSNTLITKGIGKAVVLAVGNLSQRGMKEASRELEDEAITPLQEKLERIASQIGKYGIYSAAAIFAVMTLHLIIKILFTNAKMLDGATLTSILKFFTIAVTIVMVAVPEGLPLAVSISAAYSLDKMKHQSLLVKNIEAMERMGQIDNICTGKTGTLTQNDMYVTDFYADGVDVCNDKPQILRQGVISNDCLNILIEGILYNCDSRIEMSDDALYQPEGNSTECGLLRFLQYNDYPIHEMIRRKSKRILAIVPFDSNRKREVVAVRHPDDDDLVRIYYKGAPEEIIYRSTQQYYSGRINDMSEDDQTHLLTQIVINKFAKSGNRTFAYAYKDMSYDDFDILMRDNNGFQTE